jgi:beta-lactamase class A
VQSNLDAQGFYEAPRGGGIWFGKHYGRDSERVRDPVGGHTHAATVRQLLRFYLLLEQDRLLSAEASAAMRDVFRSPEIAHVDDRFVKGLSGREREIRRKSGWWVEWSHDTAAVSGGGRHYILVALTRHPRGTAYLEGLAPAVDDALAPAP